MRERQTITPEAERWLNQEASRLQRRIEAGDLDPEDAPWVSGKKKGRHPWGSLSPAVTRKLRRNRRGKRKKKGRQ